MDSQCDPELTALPPMPPRKAFNPSSRKPVPSKTNHRSVLTWVESVPTEYSSSSISVNNTHVRRQSSSASDPSTAPTSHHPQPCDEDDDSITDPRECFAKFHDESDSDVPVADNYIPRQAELDAAGWLPIYDMDGKAHLFRDLFATRDRKRRRQLIVFLRHMYCGACQAYIRALIAAFPPSAAALLPVPLDVTVITCGHPKSLSLYQSFTSCPFPIYTDHSRALYKALHMRQFKPHAWGPRPEYVGNEHCVQTFVETFMQIGKVGLKHGTRGGFMGQVGGEFLFEEGKVTWCHRMRNIRDHTELRKLREILEIPGDFNDWQMPERDEEVVVDTAPGATEDVAPACDWRPHHVTRVEEDDRASWQRSASLSTSVAENDEQVEIREASRWWRDANGWINIDKDPASAAAEEPKRTQSGMQHGLKLVYREDGTKAWWSSKSSSGVQQKLRDPHASLESGVTTYVDWDEM